jgi:hypothetical protein
MEAQKLVLVQKMEEKGVDVKEAAKAMEFDAEVLSLYLANDSFPVPKRILDKLAAVVNA